jgi:hypothetical protein
VKRKTRSRKENRLVITMGRFFVTIVTRMKNMKTIKEFWKKYGTRKNYLLGGGVMLLIAALTSVVYMLREVPVDESAFPPAIIESTSEVFRHPLTGVPMASGMTMFPQVFGVMIENSADAWPLSGVDDAFLVIEAPVEGNIPRLIAFYGSDQSVEKIGPVRSSRAYYIDWNTELGGIYAHVGGSPEALALLDERGVFDLDQFFQSEYFYRDEQTRYAPHNVYTTTDDLQKSVEEIHRVYDVTEDPQYETWLFQDGISNASDVQTIHVEWPSSSLYNADWLYTPETNAFTRRQGGGTYTAQNIVVIETEIAVIDAVGRKELRTVGTGRALVYRNGETITGTWKKLSPTERLRFYDEAGKEVVMNAGKTWIEVVDDLDRVGTR